jgi:hypothetical protein
LVEALFVEEFFGGEPKLRGVDVKMRSVPSVV